MKPVYYHPSVPSEIREILAYYQSISSELSEGFWSEFNEAVDEISKHPTKHHFDKSGRRRSNLERFPYHILFRIFDTYIRVTVVRHNSRSDSYGARRK